MEQKIIFRQLLSELNRLADENGNRLTTQQVDDFLAIAGLTKEQLRLVYAYLTEQKIRVIGYEPEKQQPQGTGESPEAADGQTAGDSAETAAAYEADGSADQTDGTDSVRESSAQSEESFSEGETLRLYLEEIDRIGSLQPELELLLFRSAAMGDTDARSRLAEAYLNVVCDLAGEMETADMPVEDLIQEGNMGLLLALGELEEESSLAAYQARLINKINEHMQHALQDYQDMQDQDQGMTRKVSRLEEAIRKLEDELGRKVSLEELSAYLEMTMEELEGILKLT